MKMKCILCAVAALTMCSTTLTAASAEEKENVEFKRHWFLQVQAGAAYTLGEVDFGELVSPAAALYAGHRFSPVWGMRFGLSGWQSKGAWVSPESVYQYKYLQGNVDVTLDLANLFGKFNYRRTVNPYLFAGVGVNGAFGNDEANASTTRAIRSRTCGRAARSSWPDAWGWASISAFRTACRSAWS